MSNRGFLFIKEHFNPSTRPSPRLRRAGGCLLLSNVEASGRAQRELNAVFTASLPDEALCEVGSLSKYQGEREKDKN